MVEEQVEELLFIQDEKPWVYILVVRICTCILVLLYKG